MRVRLLLVLALVAAAGAVSPAAAAANCPTVPFLRFHGLAYPARTIPGSVQLPAGGPAGQAVLDSPASADGCRRRTDDVRVRRADGIDPGVGVLVEGRPRTLFVLAVRCQGFASSEYWDCLLHPLTFGGRRYTAMRYPATKRSLPVESVARAGRLGNTGVRVTAIQGVDPSLAVAVENRRGEAFVAPRVCPYEAFGASSADDDLLRCLRAPVWFSFAPPGGEPGAHVVATSDRAPEAAAAGAGVRLVRLSGRNDVVPSSAARGVPIGRVGRRIEFDLPDLPSGLYEAVVSCPRCPSSTGGTRFPAGSIIVATRPETSTGVRIVTYGLAALVAIAAAASVVVFVRRRRAARESGSGRS